MLPLNTSTAIKLPWYDPIYKIPLSIIGDISISLSDSRSFLPDDSEIETIYAYHKNVKN